VRLEMIFSAHISIASSRLMHRLPGKAISLGISFIFMLGVVAAAQTSQPNSPSAGPQGAELLQFLNETLNWHRDLSMERQIATEPSDGIVVNDNRNLADHVVQLAFQYARAEAADLAKRSKAAGTVNPNSPASQYQSLLQLSAKLDNQVKELQAELEASRKNLEAASGRKRRQLQSLVAETQSELELAQVRRDAIHSMSDFVTGASANGLGASGLRSQIEALARSLPGELSQPEAANTNDSSGNGQHLNSESVLPGNRAQPSGIWGLISDLIRLSQKNRTIDDRTRQTDALLQAAKELRAPLVNDLKQLSQKSDAIAVQADSSDASQLLQQKQTLDALTAQFRQLSTAVLPLGKQGILLGVYKASLSNWQATIRVEYRADLRALLVRLAFLAILLGFVLGMGEIWRRTIVRYVHDPRRRYQFLLLRKIVLWFSVAVVVAFAFASQIGSVATFAGLITAGVAVALQNVILSIAGYFFLIGRFGIRVGDRVQIAGVTGEVVDIGLVRLHLMELGSGGMNSPSGRIVAFSNSIVFQPTAGIFKQIPGTNFSWHEVTLQLPADSDYHDIAERLQAAVEEVLAEYRDELEKQRRYMERTLSTSSVTELRPRHRLRVAANTVEVVIRYPVEFQHANEIDDRVTRELLRVVGKEPGLKATAKGAPSLTVMTDIPSPDSKEL
jgi:small-conductance mechanosensitive channel